ncbi:DUF4280 domain-containing protein [Myxococcus sp. K38C18041901]|uniref:DUF4280 domain-containing protein n=1 Tax=Myxococcus guangdongensis TaxID=2906760 RepID=UPI0020A71262|nr:DUF4280 domain-containing protein [Myxococcus guangdongensis]MCP3064792.1 DUF4280 domain-containing protein [Myxococcus guangdongensis]
MADQVVMGASLRCSFGKAASPLWVLPVNKVLAGMPAANILDNKPFLNILPFGACQSPTNPLVMLATALAMGKPTPAPCFPVTLAPWAPGCPKVLIGNQPALDSGSKCKCQWGGVIQVEKPGQTVVQDG